MNTTTVLEARDLHKQFGSGATAVAAVTGISLQIHAGELVLVMGPSGSGKTTLISMLGGLLRPSSGVVRVDGSDITELPEAKLPAIRARTIGFVFQSFNLLSALDVEQNILFPARIAGQDPAEANTRCDDLIRRLHLETRRHALPRNLSGGEKQRVAIARALINHPKLILADEPTGNLDSQNGQKVMMILHDIARDEGRAVIIVSHDPRIEDLADRILWIEDGQLRDRKTGAKDWVRDPVCGMRVDRRYAEHIIRDELGEHVFCSERCRRRYEDSPGTYQVTHNA